MTYKKRIGILTGGGDVQPLNTVIAAAQEAAGKHDVELIGIMNGWQGILDGLTVPLSKVNIPHDVGGTILRSSRVNVATIPQGAKTLAARLEQLGIEGLIVIGGEDTLSNSLLLKDVPQVLISKTIDNDVGELRKRSAGFRLEDFVNHFTLGHPTAARKIASFVSWQEGMRTTAYSHERIIVVESMGMHAGWLALSSTMGNPDFIVVPEFPLHYESFVQMVADRYKKQKHVIVVIAEGAKWSTGAYISADETEKDSFGHPRFKGAAAALTAKLKEDLKKHFDTRNVNTVNPSYLYRSGAPCELDQRCAAMLGTQAIKTLRKGIYGPVFQSLRQEKKFVIEPIDVRSMTSIESFHRFIDERLYNSEQYTATPHAHKYWNTIAHHYPHVSYGL
jgi:6-phosphofructokinase